MSDFFGAMGKNPNALKKNILMQNKKNLSGLNVKKSEISHVATNVFVKKPAPAVLATPRLINKNLTFVMHSGNKTINSTRKHVIHANISSILPSQIKTAILPTFHNKTRTLNTTGLHHNVNSTKTNTTSLHHPVQVSNTTKLSPQKNSSSGAGILGAERDKMHIAPSSNAKLNIENGKLSATITNGAAPNKTDVDGYDASSSKKSDIPVTPLDMVSSM